MVMPRGWGWYVGDVGHIEMRDGKPTETGMISAYVYERREGGALYRGIGTTAVLALDEALVNAMAAGVDVPGVSTLLDL